MNPDPKDRRPELEIHHRLRFPNNLSASGYPGLTEVRPEESSVLQGIKSVIGKRNIK
jgi:hypothetical protein